jgi:hypothetical protein
LYTSNPANTPQSDDVKRCGIVAISEIAAWNLFFPAVLFRFFLFSVFQEVQLDFFALSYIQREHLYKCQALRRPPTVLKKCKT